MMLADVDDDLFFVEGEAAEQQSCFSLLADWPRETDHTFFLHNLYYLIN